ncbi:M20 family metallopeptidase [Aquibacillus rhizosphaerae]|uniref:M20/M25/M40 family metallo-hydrolase n=1 Tax=Aquibacillus rhizosphaerae TaxID=3051431 RepID=A0ABT7L7Z0_9BACI|nr:M20/M25/M40 family metallo-hydrolase [Aquibacillus sp. LR5S19]MDL4841981.1 M20/M25/M40 family metallo-hydrolase [Aquibacillus sp. LR5S19]
MGDPITLLEELIKIDSSNKAGANSAIDYCKQWLEQKGLSVELIKNNGYHMIVCEIGQGEDSVVLNGHIDVIEANAQQFQPYTKDGKMYGRGAVDMKAGAASMMATIANLKDRNINTKVMLQIVPDEETGGVNGTKYLTENGYLGDFIICGEPTNMGIGIQSKGVLQLDFVIEGEPAHGSRPWEGQNAITKAFSLYEDILQLPFAHETGPPIYDIPSINLATIKGGTVYNKVPERCEMSLDIRYLPDQSPDEIFKQIQGITDGTVSIHICNAPVKTKEDNPFVQKLANSIKNQTELERVNIFGQHGSNDGQFFTKFGGSAVECGPVGHDWHGHKELVYINSVREYQKVLENFLLSFQETAKKDEIKME